MEEVLKLNQPDSSLEQRLAEMEDKLNYVILQINTLKNKVGEENPELKQLLNLLQVITGTLEISKAPFTALSRTLSIKDRIIKHHPEIQYDDISKAIIDALERKKELNLSQLTDQVRKERGTASRRIVRERVQKLIEKGLIEEVDEGFGRRIRLFEISEEE